MAINYDRYAQEGNSFLKQLAKKLGHEEEIQRIGIILRAVLHTLRDRLTVGEAMDLMAQLPMFLKTVYVEDWTYREKPSGIQTLEEFTEEVKRRQDQYGEYTFDWDISTHDIIHNVLEELSPYISKGETRHILSQLPEEIKKLVEDSIR
jgi:uncharacterized protein (DUF2267 family)